MAKVKKARVKLGPLREEEERVKSHFEELTVLFLGAVRHVLRSAEEPEESVKLGSSTGPSTTVSRGTNPN